MAPTDSSVSSPAKLSTDKVRHILNRWSGDGFFRVPRLGDKAAVDEVVAHSSYAVRLWSEYEERSVSRASKPYPGGPVDDRGQPPEPWTITVRHPTDFEDRTEQVPVPHTDAVQTCTSCAGEGLTTCMTCQGWGTVNCPTCNGRGFRERQVPKTETGPSGVPTTSFETVRENCTCHGGKVTCTPCAGRGKVTCAGCAGSGRVKTYDLLTVRFRVQEKVEALNATAVPAEQLRASSGKVRVVEDGQRLETFSSVAPEVDRQADALLHASHAVAGPDTHLLFQRLRIEEVSVHEVRYRYGGGTARQLWIYGDEEKVHAPDAPWAWWRALAIVGVIVGVVAAVVAAVVYLLPLS
jgi:hypothetical protein